MKTDMLELGLQTRAEVLGNAHVGASMNHDDDFDTPLQELVTRYCWGDIWNRPGLDRKTRSLLNLVMLTALNRPQQLRLHIKGGLNNGLSKEEIREALLQAAVYCGVAAAMDSFRVAKEAFKELGV